MKRIKKLMICLFLFGIILPFHGFGQPAANGQGNQQTINLAGSWRFQTDPMDKGITEQWFSRKLADRITLPGSMTTNNKGDDISLQTPWTGEIVDSSWFFDPQYARYRVPGHIKIPFWLQPVKYYKGAAWYQKVVTVPKDWLNKQIDLFIERSHWETTLWVDNQEIGMKNSLSTPHNFDLTKVLTPGEHLISVRVDNRVKDIDFGKNSHSISDHTQGNWNGMIGKLQITARPLVYIEDVQVFPDIKNKQVLVKASLVNKLGRDIEGSLHLEAGAQGRQGDARQGGPKEINQEVRIKKDTTLIECTYAMGANPLLWDEFNPHLYNLTAQLTAKAANKRPLVTTKRVQFGMRAFSAQNTQFTINGRLVFLRGTLECAIFPKTGYPPTDVDAWLRIFRTCRSYGLNHMRFHSWCPPDAAFDAADKMGFYLQIECASWANSGATVGDGKPLDEYLYEESNRIVKAYGNHPSFCMMAYGNEPAGKHLTQYLTRFVAYWKNRDSRRLYTTASGWPIVAESDYNSTPDPRIQAWGGGLKSIINAEPPKTDYNWQQIIAKWQHPTVSHEIGQWCVYPDFKEIKEYTGVLKAKNFEIFQDKLAENGLAGLADSFLLASGKLQVLCYKADIEAALRTPGFGGFQLLDLHDFPGQGTALVGVLNPFWEDKGYVTGAAYSEFCNAVVPLAKFPKMIWLNAEELRVPVEIANFGAAPMTAVTPSWTIEDTRGRVLYKGVLSTKDIPMGNGIQLGTISQSLAKLTAATELKLRVKVEDYHNQWSFFVYPKVLPEVKGILVTSVLDKDAVSRLQAGGNVLLTLKKGSLVPEKGGKIPIGFSSIFWNTAWTHGQPPHTLGVLCAPGHPAFKAFPTEYYSNWQWWDAMSHSSPIMLDSVSRGLNPLVRVIDDWVTARSLGLVFECKVGKGKLVVSGIDFQTDADSRPEARQLKYSLERYMASDDFHPAVSVPLEKITALYNK